MREFFSKLMPYFIVGVGSVLFIAAVIMLFHLFIIGILVGFVLYLLALIKKRLFPVKQPTQNRIFEHHG